MNPDKTFLDAVEKYGQAVITKDNPALIDQIYPKIFDFIPRETVERGLKAAQDDHSVQIDFSDFGIGSIELELQIKKTAYIVFKSYCTITLKIVSTDDDDEAEMRYEFFKEKYGESNVDFDRDENKITAKTNNLILAIGEQGSWHFLEVKEHLTGMYKKFLPEQIITELVKLIPVEEPFKWPEEETTLPEKQKDLVDYSDDENIDVLYLLGWEVHFNGDEHCNNFIATQATDRETFEYNDSGLELIFENKKLKQVFEYTDGNKALRKWHDGETQIPYPTIEPNQLFSLSASSDGFHRLGGSIPKKFKLPECNSVVPFQYLGFIDHNDFDFSWLPFGIHLTHAIYLNIEKVFLDYTDPLHPTVINKEDVESADTSHDELDRNSEIIFEKQQFNFVKNYSFTGGGHAGIPNWIQYPDIPVCPKSGKRMKFLCQFFGGPPTQKKNFESDDFDEMNFWGDGDLYVFFEPESKVACYFIQNT